MTKSQLGVKVTKSWNLTKLEKWLSREDMS